MKYFFLAMISIYTSASFAGYPDLDFDRRVARTAIYENRDLFKGCYARYYHEKSGIQGNVLVTFKIDQKGKVVSSKVKSTTFNNSALENCVTSKLKMLKFQEAPAGSLVSVTYPFKFRTKQVRTAEVNNLN